MAARWKKDEWLKLLSIKVVYQYLQKALLEAAVNAMETQTGQAGRHSARAPASTFVEQARLTGWFGRVTPQCGLLLSGWAGRSCSIGWVVL